MTIKHNGFTIECDNRQVAHNAQSLMPRVVKGSRRVAIDRVRKEGWFVGAVRVTNGQRKSHVRTKRIVLCYMCKWLVVGGRG